MGRRSRHRTLIKSLWQPSGYLRREPCSSILTPCRCHVAAMLTRCG